MTNDVSFIIAIYDTIALIGMFMVIYVMQKTEHDRINSVAPPWLQWSRRLSFIIMALLLCNSILSGVSWFSLLLLVVSGIAQIMINAVALYLRSSPNNGHPSYHPAFQKRTSVKQLFASFRHIIGLHK